MSQPTDPGTMTTKPAKELNRPTFRIDVRQTTQDLLAAFV